MQMAELWGYTIKKLKTKMPDERIITNLGHDRYFFHDFGMDYTNPDWEKIEHCVETGEIEWLS